MIVFYLKAKDVGGVQVLFLNLIRELYSNSVKIKLICYKESWLISELNRRKIEYEYLGIENIRSERVSAFVNSDDILISTFLMDEYFLFLKSNPLLLFWNVFPNSLNIKNSKVSFIRKFLRKNLIKNLTKKKGLIFMDTGGVTSVINQFNISIKPEFIQIPVNTSEENLYLANKRKRTNDVINISYIGRAEVWKVKPVKKVLSDIDVMRTTERKIIFHIITDEIEEFKKQLNFLPLSVELKFYSDLSGDRLSEFLIETSDLHMAMGTSCIEGSGIGIPSILLDCSFQDFPEEYKYRWIFENENSSLGELLEESSVTIKGKTFNEILAYFDKRMENELMNISNCCFEYTKKNHSLNSVSKSFIDACSNTELRVRDILFNDIFYLNKETFKKVLIYYYERK